MDMHRKSSQVRLFFAAVPTAVLLFVASTTSVLAAVGRTPGQYSVGLSGDAQYVVPLWVPPGTNGLTPALSLAYSSHAGNGWLGRGFALPVFSTIARCNSTVAQDNAAAGLTYFPNDRYCLDGQRLRHVTGTYGATGSTYQTELESFRKATVMNVDARGPQWFEVRTRDGLIMEYGNTSDSRIRLLTGTGSVGTLIVIWAVNRIRDRAGNYIDFTYTQDPVNGGYYPQEIRWTGNTNGTTAAYKAVFVNESTDRPDTIRNQFFGTPFSTVGTFNFTKRLGRIDIYYGATSQLLRRYQLGYEPSGGTGGLSRLQSLRECGIGGTDCLSSTQLTWNSPTWIPTQLNTGDVLLAGVTPLVADITGDGRDDLVWPSTNWLYKIADTAGGFGPTRDTGVSSAGTTEAAMIRWDRDSRDDLIVAVNGAWSVLRANGNGFDPIVNTGFTASSPSALADINGDGLTDIIRKGGAGFLVRLGTGTGLGFGAETLAMTATWNPFSISAKRKRDFDGDGREDLVVVFDQVDALGNHTFQTYIVYGTGNTLTMGPGFGIVSFVGSGDFDGDGRTEAAWISAGTLRTSMNPTTGPAATPGTVTIADWNGDGKDDAIIGNTVALSTGTALSAPTATGFTPTVVRVGDVDGDTFPDLIGIESNAIKILRHTTTLSWFTRDRLHDCTDGWGVNASFVYTALNDATVHTPSSGATAPQIDLGDASVTVVKSMTSTDGTGSGATFTLSYTYEGAKADSSGRGFLGFAKRTVVDVRLGFNLRSEEILRQDWPFVGQIDTATLKQSSGARIRETKHTWKMLTYNAADPDFRRRDYPYVSSSSTKEFEAGGAFDGTHYRTITTTLAGTDGVNGIDATSGLIIDATTTTTEVATGVSSGQTHTARIYQPSVLNDTANWCIGRPQQTQSINSHSLPKGDTITRSMSMSWDAPACRPTQGVIEPGDAQLQVKTDYGYDGFGNVNSITITPAAGQDQDARQTTINWGTSGRFPLSIRNPKLQTTQYGWDVVKAVLTSVTDPNSLVVNWSYSDNFRRVTREVRPDGTATDFSLVACATLSCQEWNAGIRSYALAIERDNGSGEITRSYHYFDLFEREVFSKQRTLSGADSLVRRTFDARGSIAQLSMPYFVTDPVNNTTFSYDLLARPTLIRRPTSEQDVSNHDTEFTYQGLTIIATDALGHTLTRKLNGVGRIAQVLDAANNDTDYEYDSFGNLRTIRDVNGKEIGLAYNVRGMQTSSSDPVIGNWLYTYYPLGELKTQTNPKNQIVRFEYDVLSRPTKRTEPEGDTLWYWDTATGKGIGRLEHVDSPGGFRESYSYDDRGRVAQTSILADGSTYVLSQTYSATGLLETLTYPASTAGDPFKLRYGYQNGALQTVTDFTGDVLGTVYWQANATNARGQVIDEQLGNTLRTISGYDRISGLLDDRTSGPGGGVARQNDEYHWNKVGSLTERRELNLNLIEAFQYDSLDRLDFSQLNGVTNLDLGYDATGNIASSSDVSIGSDATITWGSYDLPTAIDLADGSYSRLQYGADGTRYKHVTSSAATGTETTINIKDLYERVTRGTTTEYRHYIFVPGGAAAVYNRKSTGTNETSYLLKDHLGSVSMITNSAGGQTARLSYNAFGKRRNGGTWSGTPAASAWTTINNTTHRGFTGHEHLDNVGLIHMNGRVFDPGIDQFMSADPVGQMPFRSQGLNSYSYVLNNPLTWVDPSGFCPATAVNLFGDGGADYGSNSPSFTTPCPLAEAYATLGLVGTAHAIAAAAAAGRGINNVVSGDPSVSGLVPNNPVAGKRIGVLYEGIAYIVTEELVANFDCGKLGECHTRVVVQPDCNVWPEFKYYKCEAVYPTYVIENTLLAGVGAFTLVRAALAANTPEAIIARLAQAHANSGLRGLASQMSVKELAAVTAGSRATRAIMGQAVHKATAQSLAELYPGKYLYFPRAPYDFIYVPTGELFELTTVLQAAGHAGRPATLIFYTLP